MFLRRGKSGSIFALPSDKSWQVFISVGFLSIDFVSFNWLPFDFSQTWSCYRRQKFSNENLYLLSIYCMPGNTSARVYLIFYYDNYTSLTHEESKLQRMCSTCPQTYLI